MPPTAKNSDRSPADPVKGSHSDQHEGQHDQRRAALAGSVTSCDHEGHDADKKCSYEEHPTGPGEPQPLAEPRHARSVGQRAKTSSHRLPQDGQYSPEMSALAGTEVVIRPGRPQDADACGRICYEAFRTVAERHGFPPDFPTPEMAIGAMENLLADPGFYGVVAERDGAIVAGSR